MVLDEATVATIAQEFVVAEEQARRLCRMMPNARLVVLEEAGHACYMRATAEFHQHLLAFVAGSHAERI